jgi:hypothetical protein
MSDDHRNYAAARGQLIAYLKTQGYRPHPDEVFCPSGEHCWVDVAALKGQDYWAFEYKSRNDSMRRGFDQCRSYARGFNYVVLVADRHRVTSSPYFPYFRAEGFGIWRHDRLGFHPILEPRRRNNTRNVKLVVERQFRHVRNLKEPCATLLSRWFEPSGRSQMSDALRICLGARGDFFG